ncbi:MAG: uridylate kinase [Methylothermaceae bacterium]|nr:uridylate kinase [Methylothermaceae bacterium]
MGEHPTLREWLGHSVRAGRGRVVIVPGGGRFADQVRWAQEHWKFDDRIAHHMALLAMHQYGLVFQGLEPSLKNARIDQIDNLLRQGETVVWLPELKELNRAGIPADWTVTSDTLAAWLAGKLHAERLVLVKSGHSTGIDPTDLKKSGLVDAAFLDWLPPHVALDCYHRSQADQFAERLRHAGMES